MITKQISKTSQETSGLGGFQKSCRKPSVTVTKEVVVFFLFENDMRNEEESLDLQVELRSLINKRN